jgi:maltose O-acetyltransferase
LRLERLRTGAPSDLLRKGVRYAIARVNGRSRLRTCTTVGAGPRVGGRPQVSNRGTINIGDSLILESVLGTTVLESGPTGTVTLGDRVFVNFGITIAAETSVSIGSDVAIGPYTRIVDTPVGGGVALPISIGRDCWLGAHVTILPGTTVGNGVTIAAGSVVSGVIPDGVIAGGAPARILSLPSAGGSGH